MRNKLFFLILTLISSSSFAIKALDKAIEVDSIKIEYISSSDRGYVYVYGCSQCKQKKYYEFNKKPIIKRKGNIISFEEFLKDYSNAKEPTVFLDPKTLKVLRVNY